MTDLVENTPFSRLPICETLEEGWHDLIEALARYPDGRIVRVCMSRLQMSDQLTDNVLRQTSMLVQAVRGLSQLLLQGARCTPGFVTGSFSHFLLHLGVVHDLGRAKEDMIHAVSERYTKQQRLWTMSILSTAAHCRTGSLTPSRWHCGYPTWSIQTRSPEGYPW